jgi:hypothetical protein
MPRQLASSPRLERRLDQRALPANRAGPLRRRLDRPAVGGVSGVVAKCARARRSRGHCRARLTTKAGARGLAHHGPPYVRALPDIVRVRKSASKRVACSRFSNLNLVPEKLLNIRE